MNRNRLRSRGPVALIVLLALLWAALPSGPATAASPEIVFRGVGHSARQWGVGFGDGSVVGGGR